MPPATTSPLFPVKTICFTRNGFNTESSFFKRRPTIVKGFLKPDDTPSSYFANTGILRQPFFTYSKFPNPVQIDGLSKPKSTPNPGIKKIESTFGSHRCKIDTSEVSPTHICTLESATTATFWTSESVSINAVFRAIPDIGNREKQTDKNRMILLTIAILFSLIKLQFFEKFRIHKQKKITPKRRNFIKIRI